MSIFDVNIPSQIDNDLNPSTTQGASKTAINTGLTAVQNAAASDATTKANAALSSAQTYADAKVAQTITNGVTTSAPSQDAVFDALALKQDSLTSDNFGTFVDSLAAKTTPVDADTFLLKDSAATNDAKEFSWADLKARLPRVGNPFFSTSNISIIDSGPLFFGQVATAVNTLATSSLVHQFAGKIIGFGLIGFNAATVGSNEDCTVILHYNDGAASATITTTFKVSGNRNFRQTVTGLNIDINDGGTAIELQNTGLATNPNAFRFYAIPLFG